jgi:hypothetical protein
MRLVQIARDAERRVCVVDDARLVAVHGYTSTYDLAMAAAETRVPFTELASRGDDLAVDYQAIYAGRSEWRILPVIGHPNAALQLVGARAL